MLIDRLHTILRRFCGRGAAVAMIFAMCTPLLLAATGLSVDVGLWMEREASLQSAADAAALGIANAAAKYSITSATGGAFATGTGENFAVAAANAATQSQFGLNSSGSSSVTVSFTSTAAGNTTILKWNATATTPRAQFFSMIHGLGISGLTGGSQSASGTAAMAQSNSSGCIITNGVVQVTGGGFVKAANCSFDNNYIPGTTTCPASATTYVSGSGKIMGSSGVIVAAGCVGTNGGSTTSSTTLGSGYIGTDTSGSINNGNTSSATTNGAILADPVAALNPTNVALWNPGWTAPSAPTGMAGPYTPQLGYNMWTQAGVGDCINMAGNYSAQCEVFPNWLTGMTNIQVNKLILNENTTNGKTYITGGFTGQSNGVTTMNGNNYYISGGMTMADSTGLTISDGTSTTTCGGAITYLCVVVNGGMTLTNGANTLGNGIYYITGANGGLASTSNASGWGFTENVSSIAFGAGNYYVNGGIGITNNSPTLTMGSGLYELQAYAGNTNAACTGTNYCGTLGAFYVGQGTDTFGSTPPNNGTAPAPATYYFDGGLTISGGACNTVFNPGIYYIRNGNLVIDSCTNMTATGVTFVLEGTAAYTVEGGASINFTAPTSNCVDPASYPEAAYENSTSPYDGTNGEGICGIAIYQARGDTTADQIGEGGTTTFNGAIYAPSAALTVSGGGSLNITTTDTTTTKLPGLEITSLTDTGSGNITVNENSNGGGGGATSSTKPVLIN